VNKKLNVLFIWNAEPELKKHFRKQFSKNKNIALVFPKSFSEKSMQKHYTEADVIIGWRPSKEMLIAAENLKLFINPGTGIKHHIENFREINRTRKIVLVNGHGHAYATAQHTVAMLLALMNRMIPHHQWMAEGIWRTSDDKDITSSTLPLRDSRIGLLGYGAINKYVHRFLSGFENEFHILKRSRGKTNADNISGNNKAVRYLENDLNKFLKAIDILIIAIPHTSKTEGMIGAKELRLLGKTGLLVNVARGTIVSEKPLYDALKNKIISGAALDVWYNYNPKKDKQGKAYPSKYPFHKLKNIILSPHRAASPFDDLKRWDEVFENINRAAKGRQDFLNIVDLEEEY